MKSSTIQIRSVLIFLVLFTLAGCDLIEGIFTFGVGVGVLMVILIIALIWWLIVKIKR